MTRGTARIAAGFIAAALLAATLSCTAIDDVPPPDAEMQQRIAMLARSLEEISIGERPQADVFAERLDNLCRFPPADTASRALADALIGGLAGKRLSPSQSKRLAEQIYRVMNGGYMSRRPLQRVARAMENDLLAAQVDPRSAFQAHQAAIQVARAPRDPRTSWW